MFTAQACTWGSKAHLGGKLLIINVPISLPGSLHCSFLGIGMTNCETVKVEASMRFLLLLVASAIPLACLAEPVAAGKPVFDKSDLAAYIRYAEAFTDSVAVSPDDPVPSPFPGFWKLVVHITAGTEHVADKIYYVNREGTQIINGAIWTVPGSPFTETLSLLPSGIPSSGPADAPINIVMFSDFECPFCRQFAHTVREDLTKSLNGRVRMSFADFPLESKHPWARAAAEASHCVGDGNTAAFWKFHDWIFDHQNEVTGKNLKDMVVAFSGGQGLDISKIAACMDSHATAAEVSASEQVARLLEVRQTPTFFINGRKIEGALPWTNLKSLVDYELRRPKIATELSAHPGGASPQ